MAGDDLDTIQARLAQPQRTAAVPVHDLADHPVSERARRDVEPLRRHVHAMCDLNGWDFDAVKLGPIDGDDYVRHDG